MYQLLNQKKMENGSTFIGIALTIVCLLPIILMYIKKKKSGNLLLNKLKQIAQENQCQISHYECKGDFIIGLDEQQKRLFFYKKNNKKEDAQTIHLTDFAKVLAQKSTYSNSKQVGAPTVVEKVALVFYPKKKMEETIVLELFNDETNLQLSGEIQLADHWQQKLKTLMA